jgi:hypothetical protein
VECPALPELLAHRKRQRRQRVSTACSWGFVGGEVSGDPLPPLPGSLPYRAPVSWRSRRNHHRTERGREHTTSGAATSRNADCLDRRLASPSAPACSPPARSGSERPRLPPQVGPQPMHPVRQNISGHSEVCGDIGVSPAVYDSVLQQDAVVRGQVPEEGAKSVRCSLHSGDLGRDGHRAAVPPWCSRYFSCPPVASALDIPGSMSKAKGAPRKYQNGPSSWPRGRAQGRMGIPTSPVWQGVGIIGRLGPANKLQFPALLWPSCAKSGILFLHGGQREPGIPEPRAPWHIRERLKEVRATHVRILPEEPH